MSAATEAATQPLPENLVNEKLVRWWFLAALTYLAISMLGGILMALQLIHWNPFTKIELLSAGRWRMIHTNAVAYGFIASAFLGMLEWTVPRLTMQRVLSDKLSYFIFFAWQVVVCSTAAGIIIGPSLQDQEWVANLSASLHLPMNLGAQGLEWGETPFWIDPLALAGLALVGANYMTPIARAKGPMYVTLWYFMAAFVWTFLTYAMGNFLPEYSLQGTSAGAVSGLFIHDLVGLFVTPLGWGMMYYIVPILLKKPIWSHGLSLVGFWGLAFFYPLQGIHHFLYTPIPMFLQYGAIISTIAVEFVVATVVINFVGTIWGDGRKIVKDIPLRWFYTGMIFYFITCFQCALQVTLTFQKLIHFTDWVVGHAHLVMFGVFSMWIFGMMTYLFPRLLGRQWASRRLCEWHYWLSAFGVFIMFLDLTLAGVFQGYYWSSLQPWDASVYGSQPFWITRLFAGLMIFSGYCCFITNLYYTWRSPVAETAPATNPELSPA
ncbi:MAG: cbb3-type cytochrome c oxidase subunit I [Planctomycetales bacterium]|nr:cbb3-type cytochrome c oxidase subunit I [Planctomycetales bacterium]